MVPREHRQALEQIVVLAGPADAEAARRDGLVKRFPRVRLTLFAVAERKLVRRERGESVRATARPTLWEQGTCSCVGDPDRSP